MQTETKGQPLSIKILAIIGFSATILLLTWLLVVVVKTAPETFSSLASIVSTKEEYKEELREDGDTTIKELTLETQKTLINAGEPFLITWTNLEQDGTYTLTFSCEEELVILFGNPQNPKELSCGDSLELPITAKQSTLGILSKNSQYSDVTITLSFMDSNAEILTTSDITVTILNAQMGSGAGVEEEATTTPETNGGGAATTTPQQTTPIYYGYPTSDPNGYVDITVSVVRTTAHSIVIDIKNNGTRTSDAWSFIVTSSGTTLYNSPQQIALKPKEHAVFTLQTGTVSNGVVTVLTQDDIHFQNNSTTY